MYCLWVLLESFATNRTTSNIDNHFFILKWEDDCTVSISAIVAPVAACSDEPLMAPVVLVTCVEQGLIAGVKLPDSVSRSRVCIVSGKRLRSQEGGCTKLPTRSGSESDDELCGLVAGHALHQTLPLHSGQRAGINEGKDRWQFTQLY